MKFFSGIKLICMWDGTYYGKNTNRREIAVWFVSGWAYHPGDDVVYRLEPGELPVVVNDEEADQVREAFLSATARWDVSAPAIN